MLLIPCRIRPSVIHGLGCFTTVPIPMDTLVWQYREPVDQRVPIEYDPSYYTEFIKRYAYQPIGKYYLEIVGDAALFMNHSETPNVICPDNDDMFAGRDIEAGEELVCNYREFDRLAEADISSWKSQT